MFHVEHYNLSCDFENTYVTVEKRATSEADGKCPDAS